MEGNSSRNDDCQGMVIEKQIIKGKATIIGRMALLGMVTILGMVAVLGMAVLGMVNV